MPLQKIKRALLEGNGVVITVVFTLNFIILLIVLTILWNMPENKMEIKNCGYMCLQFKTMHCGCRDEILLKYNEMVS